LNSVENEISENTVKIIQMSDDMVKMDSRVKSCEQNMVDMATGDSGKDKSYSDALKTHNERVVLQKENTQPPARELTEPRGSLFRPGIKRKDACGARGDGEADSIRGALAGASHADDVSQTTDDDRSGFLLARDDYRRLRRGQRKTITTGIAGNRRLRGGPPPMKDFFLYRVLKPANEDDVIECLNENDIKYNSVLKVSKEEARYCSFKLTIPVSEIKKAMEPEVWPEGVRIRRFTTRYNQENGY
jgi:hypothetical protein